VGIACQAQLVNIIAPIRTEPGGPAWRQTIFHPFALTARLARGQVLRVEPQGPSVVTDRYGEVAALDATATLDPESGATTLLAVNRDPAAPLQLEVDLRGLVRDHGDLEVVEHHVVGGDLGELGATNTRDHPERVAARAGDGARVTDGRLTADLLPASWTAIRLRPISARGDHS
jgi:alpha-N-arabinofuranosidase